jgi:hypothetical protein
MKKKKQEQPKKKAGDFLHQLSDASDPEQITTLNSEEWSKEVIKYEK